MFLGPSLLKDVKDETRCNDHEGNRVDEADKSLREQKSVRNWNIIDLWHCSLVSMQEENGSIAGWRAKRSDLFRHGHFRHTEDPNVVSVPNNVAVTLGATFAEPVQAAQP